MSKKNIQLNIKAEELKQKLNIKDGYTPVKGKDYFDGETPIIDTQDIVTRVSKLAQVELEKLIPVIEPYKITDKDIEDISLDVQSQIEPKFEELKEKIEEAKGQRINTGFKAFKNLTDAPHSYNGQGGKTVKVKTDETGLEFGVDSDQQDLTDVLTNGSTFEAFSKNLLSYPYTIAETSSTVTTIVYTTSGGTITKTITEVSPTVTTIVFSGDYPAGLPTTKTITDGNPISITYS